MGVLIQYVVVQAVMMANIFLSANDYAVGRPSVDLILIDLIEVMAIITAYAGTTGKISVRTFMKNIGMVGGVSAVFNTLVVLTLMGYGRVMESIVNTVSESLLIGVFAVLFWLPLPALAGFYIRRFVDKRLRNL